MAGRVVFFLQHASFEPAHMAATMSVTAAAMGDEVYVVFTFDALRQLVRGSFGLPHTDREIAESARAEGLGVQSPLRMLEEARVLGAKLVAADSTLKICGMAPDDMGEVLDQVLSIADIWRLTEGARTISF